jgi:transcriptional regulator with XRE-family HTH domain
MKSNIFDEETQDRAKDVKGFRLAVGLSLEAFAKRLGIPAFRLDKIEKGIQICSEELRLKASEVYGEEQEILFPEPDFDELENFMLRD